MAVDIYLRIDGITGESQAAGFKGQIQLQSVNLEAVNPVNIALGAGGGGGKMSFGPMTVTKSPDSASPQIFLMLAQGTHIATATLSFVHSGATTAYITIDLNMINFTAMTTSVTGGVPLETISLVYSVLKYTVQQQGPTGVAKPPVSGGWDTIKNIKL